MGFPCTKWRRCDRAINCSDFPDLLAAIHASRGRRREEGGALVMEEDDSPGGEVGQDSGQEL